MAFALIAAAMVGAPAYANVARAVYCGDSFFDDDGFSGFVNTHGSVYWTGGGETSDFDYGVGVRINTGGKSNGAFSLASTSTGNADPFMFYVFTTNGSNACFSDCNIVQTSGAHGINHFNFKGLPHGQAMLAIYFADFGDCTEGNFFQDVVASPTVPSGAALPVYGAPQSDCSIEY